MKHLRNSFSHAIDGLVILVAEEPNYLIHLLATVLVLGLGLLIKLSATEWSLLILAIVGVLVTETLNTSIENIMDFVTTKKRAEIKKIKDLAAAAVLIATIGAVVIGLIILLPKTLAYFLI